MVGGLRNPSKKFVNMVYSLLNKISIWSIYFIIKKISVYNRRCRACLQASVHIVARIICHRR